MCAYIYICIAMSTSGTTDGLHNSMHVWNQIFSQLPSVQSTPFQQGDHPSLPQCPVCTSQDDITPVRNQKY